MDRPAEGEFYRDDKGQIYQIRMIAKEVGSGRQMVVFQAMYAPFSCLACDLSAFLGQMQSGKYHVVKQGLSNMPQGTAGVQKEHSSMSRETAGLQDQMLEPLSDEELEQILTFGNIEKYVGIRITEEEVRERGFMMFLDADNFRAKRQIFLSMKPYLTGILLNNIAVTLDLVLEEQGEDEQFDAILKCLGAREHYEGGRLR